MARLAGIIKFEGTVDGISVYHHKLYGWIVRRKGGPDPEKMKSQKRFERVRENGKEFGACARAAGLVRRSLRSFVEESGDAMLNGRLTKLFIQIKNLDKASGRGKRHPGEGLRTPAGRALLEGLEFNSQVRVDELIRIPYTVDNTQNGLRINGLIPKKHLKFPKGATHARFKTVLLGLDFAANKSETLVSAPQELALDNKSSEINLRTPVLNKAWDLRVLLLQVCFYQTVNGKDYQLQDKSFNAMRVLKVEGGN